jgi:excisionase family DNA binding protein
MLTRQFLSVKDVADLLKVGEVAVRNRIKDEDLRAVNIGREWRIAPKDLGEFLQRHTNRPPRDDVLPEEAVGGPESPSRDAG